MENELPQGWIRTTLGAIAKINPGVDTSQLPDSILVSFVPMAAVEAETGHMDASKERRLDEVRRGYTAFQEGDILFAKITPCMENGKFTIAKSLISNIGFGSTEFHVLRPEADIDPGLIFYYLVQQSFRQSARSNMTGSAGQLRVPAAFLANASYPLPPINEQHRIVAAIEQQFSRLDAAVTSLQHARAKLKRQRAAILKAAVEGTLTAGWRTQHPASETAEQLLQRILHERRAKWEVEQLAKMQARGVTPKDEMWKDAYKEPESLDTTNLLELPEGWCWTKFGQAAFFQNGRGFPSSEYIPEGFKLLRPGNLYADGIVQWNLSNTRCLSKIWAERNPDLIVNGHELVINLTAQSLKDEFLGRVCITSRDEQCLLNQRLARITPLKGLNPLYTLYMLKSSFFRRFVDGLNKGSLIQHMFTSQLENFSFPLPPLSEQQQIVSEVEARLSIIAQTELEVEANLKRAERLRQTILAEAFAGRLVPQDPRDEPASVLLERIRRERNGMQKKGKAGNGRARSAIKVPDEPVKIDAEGMEQVELWESVGGPPPADDVLFIV